MKIPQEIKNLDTSHLESRRQKGPKANQNTAPKPPSQPTGKNISSLVDSLSYCIVKGKVSNHDVSCSIFTFSSYSVINNIATKSHIWLCPKTVIL